MRERLASVVHLKIEILQDDRKSLGGCSAVRESQASHSLDLEKEQGPKASVELFRKALGGTELTEKWKELLPWGIWLAHLAIMLFFLHDESEGQRKSHHQVDRGVEILAGLVEWTNSMVVRPWLKPFQAKTLEMLREARWSGPAERV